MVARITAVEVVAILLYVEVSRTDELIPIGASISWSDRVSKIIFFFSFAFACCCLLWFSSRTEVPGVEV